MASGLISTGVNLSVCAAQKEDQRGIIPLEVRAVSERTVSEAKCRTKPHFEGTWTD